jgi:hypothetical protein
MPKTYDKRQKLIRMALKPSKCRAQFSTKWRQVDCLCCNFFFYKNCAKSSHQ